MTENRNYRALAAERLAEIADLKLQLESWRRTRDEERALNEAHRQLNGRLREEIAELTETVNRQVQVNSATNQHNIDLGEELEGLKDLCKAQKDLMKRVEWFLMSYPVEGDLAAVTARTELIGALGALTKD